MELESNTTGVDYRILQVNFINAALNRGVRVRIKNQDIVHVGKFCCVVPDGSMVPLDVERLYKSLRERRLV